MPSRPLMVDGVLWRVSPSGLITQFDADEFGLVFTRGSGDTVETRVTRYSPRGAMSREASLAELNDADLRGAVRGLTAKRHLSRGRLPNVTVPSAPATVDLQVHSTASDGAATPAAVASAAADAGFRRSRSRITTTSPGSRLRHRRPARVAFAWWPAWNCRRCTPSARSTCLACTSASWTRSTRGSVSSARRAPSARVTIVSKLHALGVEHQL